jgi:hypothetical protein
MKLQADVSGRLPKFENPELMAAPPSKAVAADMFLTMRLNGDHDPQQTSMW